MKWVTDKQTLTNRMKEVAGINKVMNPGVQPPTKPSITFEQKKPTSLTLETSDPNINASYVIYRDKKDLDKEINNKKKFHLWVKYPHPGYSKNLQRKYEIFCGGYLQFYDLVLSNEGQDRQVYMVWTKKSVQIYLSNPPKGKGYKDSVIEFKKAKYKFVDYDVPPPSDSDVDPPPLPSPPPPPDA
jgi:hypothetical protein